MFEDIQGSADLRKIAALVDSWKREEHGKTRVAIGAFLGFVALIAIFFLAALFLPLGSALFVFPIGFVAWIALVVSLMTRFLGKRRKPDRRL